MVACTYQFEEVDEALTLLPMAARRALDIAGTHLPLSAWQLLPLGQRRELVQLGAAERVAVDDVRACLREVTAELRAEPPLLEPDPAAGVPAALRQALGAEPPPPTAAWAALPALDRYVLRKLAERGKRERVLLAWREIRAAARI
jgi:hypothetical protein